MVRAPQLKSTRGWDIHAECIFPQGHGPRSAVRGVLKMSDLLSFALAVVHAVDPDHEHPVMTDAIVHVVEDERPLFTDDASREKTIALLVAVAWREGSLREKVIGDCVEKNKEGGCIAHPRSFCTMQIHASSGGDESLNTDPEKCIRAGIAILRQSMKACAEYPIAWYASGPN